MCSLVRAFAICMGIIWSLGFPWRKIYSSCFTDQTHNLIYIFCGPFRDINKSWNGIVTLSMALWNMGHGAIKDSYGNMRSALIQISVHTRVTYVPSRKVLIQMLCEDPNQSASLHTQTGPRFYRTLSSVKNLLITQHNPYGSTHPANLCLNNKRPFCTLILRSNINFKGNLYNSL